MRTFIFVLCVLWGSVSYAQSSNFQIYSASGEKISLDALLARFHEVEVVFIGEMHNDSVGHVVEYTLLKEAHRQLVTPDSTLRRPIALSLEMFERDVQLVLDEYLQGLIREKDFLRDSRPWRNYHTDYRPMVEYARQHKFPVLAANAPQRYVSLVSRKGLSALESLSYQARTFLPPLPFAASSERYAQKFRRQMQEMMRAMLPDSLKSDSVHVQAMPHGNPYMLEGQTLRDASMAYTLATFLMKAPHALVIQVNGAFHSEAGLGIPEHLRQYRPGTRMLILTLIPEAHFDSERMSTLGDYIILTGLQK